MEKKKASLLFRTLALCSAIGLGGTYVWRQHQKDAPQIDNTVERTVLSDIAPTPLPVEQEKTDRVLLPGPKSAGVLNLERESKLDRALMPGSKVGIIELKSGETKERTLMPGSKSFIVTPKPPETTPPLATPKANQP